MPALYLDSDASICIYVYTRSLGACIYIAAAASGVGKKSGVEEGPSERRRESGGERNREDTMANGILLFQMGIAGISPYGSRRGVECSYEIILQYLTVRFSCFPPRSRPFSYATTGHCHR